MSDELTGILLRSIITTTDRARYYSFYTWVWSELADLQEKAGEPLSPERLQGEFQRREAAFAVASLWGRKSDLPIVGIRQVESRASTPGDEDDELDLEFRVLPSNSLGGFGQYYGGCLHGLELVGYDPKTGLAEKPTALGQELARAFASAAARAPFIANPDYRRVRHVPRGVLKQSRELFSLDALTAPAANGEREKLIALFFSLGQRPTMERPLKRQASLALLLHTLVECERAGVTVPRRDVDEHTLYWPHYYGLIGGADAKQAPYQAPPCLAEVRGYWEHFCGHQFAAFAMEEFLAAALAVLSVHPNGLTRPELVDSLAGPAFAEALAELVGETCKSPAALLATLGIEEPPTAESSRRTAARFSGGSVLNEWSLYQDAGKSASKRLARSFVLMAMLYGKWAGRVAEPRFQEVEQSAHREYWLGTLFPWLETWREGPSWVEAVAHVFNDIFARHDQVKLEKRRLDACWIEEVVGGRLVHQQDLQPDFRSSRHGNAVTILQDLGLLERAKLDEPLKVTPQGKQVLAEVLRLRA